MVGEASFCLLLLCYCRDLRSRDSLIPPSCYPTPTAAVASHRESRRPISMTAGKLKMALPANLAITVVGFVGQSSDLSTLRREAASVSPWAPLHVVDLSGASSAAARDCLRLASLLVVSQRDAQTGLLCPGCPTLCLAEVDDLADSLVRALPRSLKRSSRSKRPSELETLIRQSGCFGRAKALVSLLPADRSPLILRGDDVFLQAFGPETRLAALRGPLTCDLTYKRLETALLTTQAMSTRLVLYRPRGLLALPVEVVVVLTPLSGSADENNRFNPSRMRIGVLTVISAASLPRSAPASHPSLGLPDEDSVRSDIVDDADDVAGLFWWST